MSTTPVVDGPAVYLDTGGARPVMVWSSNMLSSRESALRYTVLADLEMVVAMSFAASMRRSCTNPGLLEIACNANKGQQQYKMERGKKKGTYYSTDTTAR